MQISPLRLRRLFFARTVVEALCDLHAPERIQAENFDFSDITLGVETGMGTAENDDTDFMVELTIRLEPENQPRKLPYRINIRAIGLIQIASIISKERRHALVEVNGLAMVYGAIREMVLNITSRSQDGPLTLPTVNFVDHAEKAKAAVLESSKKVATPPPT